MIFDTLIHNAVILTCNPHFDIIPRGRIVIAGGRIQGVGSEADSGSLPSARESLDAQGGIVKLVSEGAIQSKVSAQAYKMQRDIESGEFRKVGVNCYRNEQEEDHAVEFHPYNEDDARVQIDSLKRIRAERDNNAVAAALTRLRTDASAGTNVMPALVEAVKAYASVGEMTKELVNVFGRYQEPIRF